MIKRHFLLFALLLTLTSCSTVGALGWVKSAGSWLDGQFGVEARDSQHNTVTKPKEMQDGTYQMVERDQPHTYRHLLLGELSKTDFVVNNLGREDFFLMHNALQRTHDEILSVTINWRNPETGNSGQYTAVRQGFTAAGQYCREYQQKLFVDGREYEGYGTLCRNDKNGAWDVISTQ